MDDAKEEVKPVATELLEKAAQLQRDRAKTYDKGGTMVGERSMGRTVAAFNIITGQDLTESEGWLLLQVLKDVRDRTNGPHLDSLEDGISYSSLKAEARLKEIPAKPAHASEERKISVDFLLGRNVDPFMPEDRAELVRLARIQGETVALEPSPKHWVDPKIHAEHKKTCANCSPRMKDGEYRCRQCSALNEWQPIGEDGMYAA